VPKTHKSEQPCQQQSAGAAGAIGAIVYNNTDGELNGTLGDPANAAIPTGGITQSDGLTLAGKDGASRSRARTSPDARTTASSSPLASPRAGKTSMGYRWARPRRRRSSERTGQRSVSVALTGDPHAQAA
jgi:hypothetical protein